MGRRHAEHGRKAATLFKFSQDPRSRVALTNRYPLQCEVPRDCSDRGRRASRTCDRPIGCCRGNRGSRPGVHPRLKEPLLDVSQEPLLDAVSNIEAQRRLDPLLDSNRFQSCAGGRRLARTRWKGLRHERVQRIDYHSILLRLRPSGRCFGPAPRLYNPDGCPLLAPCSYTA